MNLKNNLIIAMASLLIAGCDGGVDTGAYDLLQPDFEYELDTWGANSEIYEFTPRSRDDYTCVMFMLDKKNAMSMQCFPKKEMANEKTKK